MKENKRILKRKEKGITLIALVITIIVLLILAGISIAMLTGENGILTQAQRAKEETEQAEKDEMSDIASMESLINEHTQDIDIPQVTDEKPGELEQENENTFVINSIEDLVVFSYNVRNGNKYENQTVKLGTNLDFKSDKSYVNPNRTDFVQYGYNGQLKQALISGSGFISIGGNEETNSFSGIFDGNNNAICSLYIDIDKDENVGAGFFITTYGEIRNLGLVNVNITAIAQGKNFAPVGGIAKTSYNNIYNCYVTGNINVTGGSWTPVGGICGVMQKEANIENCYNLANINATNIKEGWGSADIGCGGIVGQGKANINKCYNKGKIIVNGGDNAVSVGGICGHLDDGYIKNCYNNAKIEVIGSQTQGNSYIGGIVAISTVDNITNCYNSGEIIHNIHGVIVGGILGEQRVNGTISNVFNVGKIDIKLQDVSGVGGIIGLIAGNGEIHANINNAYNIGNIEIEEKRSYIGSIAASNWANVMTYNNCCYLAGTYEVGVDSQGGSKDGIKELQNISDFPSVLSVVNGEGAFKEDTNNINNGYPILDFQ